MRKFENVVLLTQSQAYEIVKSNIRESFQAMLDEFMDGHEEMDCFKPVYNLKEEFQKMEQFFRDICALQIFAETGAELIIITSHHKNAIISRDPYQEVLDNQLDPIIKEAQKALSS